MSNDLFLIPRDGLTVRDPKTREPLRAEGERKPRSSYWLRRLKDGDVVEGKPKTNRPQPNGKGADKSSKE